ncbi:MAG: glucose-6-phosphate isomerase [Gammaproteobacteria bacterium]|nr:glucose-6-phosphate isomerase [Gammaproteobacteria bacterium]
MPKSLTATSHWQALQKHAREMSGRHMRQLFEQDPQRSERYSLFAADWQLDFSKNLITDKTLQLLLALAKQQHLTQWRDRMFAGEKINHTENRAVLHVALRSRSGETIEVEGEDVVPQVRAVQAGMREFSDAIRDGKWTGYSGKAITDVVNIGIGGSDLGPMMVCQALAPYAKKELNMHFVSNIDGSHIHDTLQRCQAETTLFIISSKSFSTQETLNNALAARGWFLAQGGSKDQINRHFVAVTSNNKLATEFGIAPDSQFELWDWVGGRYSLWSAIGLPIAIALGMDQFEDLLGGAYAMDEHFRNAQPEQNMPVLLALLGVWYNNFLECETYAVLPYIQHLSSFPAYLQQADMESNGKRIDRNGLPVDYQTGPILWGGAGTNAQHAFFQLLHQGTKTIPADFIIARDSHSPYDNQQRMLVSNALAQMEALMRGKSKAEVAAEMLAKGLPQTECARLAPYREFAGNKPSNALFTDQLTPAALGALIALYEHKIFVQGVIWNINSYDQWGVEYGKQVANSVLPVLEGAPISAIDVSSSTRELISRLRRS